MFLLCSSSGLNAQELDSDLKNCKDEFKQFEREDVKYREDLKHMKQKIKKLTDKLEKVGKVITYDHIFELKHELIYFIYPIQDSSKIEDLGKESENSTILIPKLEERIPELQKFFVEEEKVLEEVIESSKGFPLFLEIEVYRIFLRSHLLFC